MTTPNNTNIIKVPALLFETSETRVLNVNKLSRDEMLSLRRSDPFMYFSIPGNLKANEQLKDTHESAVTQADKPAKRRRMEPSRPVQRRKRVSYETYPLDSLMNLMEELEDDA